MVVSGVAPMVVHRRARLPSPQRAAHERRTIRHGDLWRVVVVVRRVAVLEVGKPVVDEHVGLVAAADVEQSSAVEIVLFGLVLRKVVEEHQVDLAVLCRELIDMVAHELTQRRMARRIVRAALTGPDPFRCLQVNVAVMRPVGQRMIEANAKAFGAERIDEHSENVLPVWRIGDLVVREMAVEHAEPVVVPRGEDDVFYARRLRKARPDCGIVVRRVERLRQRLVFVLRHHAAREPPLALCWNRIDPPVYEKAEARIAEPCVARILAPLGAIARHLAFSLAVPPRK